VSLQRPVLDAPTWDRQQAAKPFADTQLRMEWANRVKGEIANDFVIVVTPHSATAGSGSGKTTLALQLCKAFDVSERGFDAQRNATLDAGALTEEVLDQSQSGSALLWDEAQGAPGTDGLDARRAMQSDDGEQERPLSDIADEIESMEPAERGKFVTWHGGHHKWIWSLDRLRRSFDLIRRRARSLKDHLVEMTDLSPAETAEAAGREPPE